MLRFIGRVAVAAAVAALWLFFPGSFHLLEGMAFFRSPSPLHLLWGVWMADMVLQLIPARRHIALGSQKQLARFFQAGRTPDRETLRGFIRSSNRGALRVLLIWLALTLALGGLYLTGVLNGPALLLISVLFYVCDLICVLFWCPFRVFLLKNRCCTTCRIFNWDHLMMFSPLFFVPSFYTLSLAGAAVAVFAVWEIQFRRRPAFFWERTNRALRCISCTDQLCGGRKKLHKQ